MKHRKGCKLCLILKRGNSREKERNWFKSAAVLVHVHDKEEYLRVLSVSLVIALGFFAAAKSARNRKGEGVCVVCSFWGSVDNLRPNLPAVVGHGLLSFVPAINAFYSWKKTNWIWIHAYIFMHHCAFSYTVCTVQLCTPAAAVWPWVELLSPSIFRTERPTLVSLIWQRRWVWIMTCKRPSKCSV